MTKICGIDEAGRGPVIGPMVMAGLMIDEKDYDKLKNLGLKDSKMLTPEQRDMLYDRLMGCDYIKYEIAIIQPKEIDDCLNSANFNLNMLEGLHSAMLINKLKPEKVILDLPSNNAEKYNSFVRLNLNVKCEIISEHKADVNHPIVSGASILAKVTRDREIEKIKNKIKVNFGSGYPSDPYTVDFLKKNFNKKEYSDIFRKTWESYKRLAEGTKQKQLGSF